MRGMKHIPVDRTDGQPAYEAAVRALQAGEVVGVFPEATISRSFTLKKFKTGAARMAADSGTPLLPVILWGTQQLWTKGRPKTLTKRHVPVIIMIGEPIYLEPGDKPGMVTCRLRAAMTEMLDRAQRMYPTEPTGRTTPGGCGPPRGHRTHPRGRRGRGRAGGGSQAARRAAAAEAAARS